jgi:septal ring factor EnvC (AmiA/AmiB activator)
MIKTKFSSYWRLTLKLAMGTLLTAQGMAVPSPANAFGKDDQPANSTIDMANSIHNHEDKLLIVDKDLNQALGDEIYIRESLDNLDKSLKKIVYFLYQVGNRGIPMALVIVTKPEDIIHATVLMRSIIPGMNRQKQDLSSKLKDFSDRRKLLEQKKNELQAVAFQLYPKPEFSSPDLNRQTESKNSSPPLSDDLGMSFKAPVSGKLIATYGSQHPEWIPYSQGVLYLTRRNSQVISPITGIIAFAGQYAQGQDKVVIIQKSSTHITLSGLGQISCTVGQKVECGQPIGHMPGLPPLKNTKESSARLYVEIGNHEQTIDPQILLNPKGNQF